MPRPRYAGKRKWAGAAPAARSAKRSRFVGPRRALVPLRRTTPSRLESKFVDVNANFYFDNTASSNSHIHPLNLIAQGVGPFERIGRKTQLQAVRLQYEIQPYLSPALADRLKVCIVLDKHPDGVVPTYDLMFTSRSSNGTLLSDVDSFPNVDQADRFRILHSRVYATGQADLGAPIARQNMDAQLMKADVYVKLNTPQLFRGATANIADCQSSAIYLVVMSQGATLASQTWLCHMSSRVRYTE